MSLIFLSDIFVFLFGLCIGSFLNVVIYRLEKEESFVLGRSYCPKCRHQLIWLDLIPVFSFLFLQGKCRYCGKKISIQYPLVEIATGLMFLAIFSSQYSISNAGNAINLVFLLYIVSSLIVIFVYDLKFYLIPDKVLFPAIIITFFYRFFEFFHFGHWNLFGMQPSGVPVGPGDLGFGISPNIFSYVLAFCIASGFFLIIYLISKGAWMGFGDVKLAILLGLLLGFPAILVGLFLSFFFGAILGGALLFLKKKGLKSEIPFAPFLIIGTFVALFFGQQIIQWYLNFFI